LDGTAVRKLAAEAFIVKNPVQYVDSYKLKTKFSHLYDRALPANTILVGPSGIAKSLSVRAFAYERKVPLVVTDCAEDTRRHHLIGTRSIEKDSTPFVYGDMATAVDVANENGQCIYLVEEINALTPQIQKLFNPLCEDFGQRVLIPEANLVLTVKNGAKLWTVATMNTGLGYGGIYTLNDDLKRRFRMIPLDYPTKAEEQKIVSAAVSPTPDPDLVEKVITFATETRQTNMGYSLSPSDVIHILQDAAIEGIREALRNTLGKFEGQNRKVIEQRIGSIFPKK
jgi:MoxR-like ATPase